VAAIGSLVPRDSFDGVLLIVGVIKVVIKADRWLQLRLEHKPRVESNSANWGNMRQQRNRKRARDGRTIT